MRKVAERQNSTSRSVISRKTQHYRGSTGDKTKHRCCSCTENNKIAWKLNYKDVICHRHCRPVNRKKNMPQLCKG